MTKGCDRWKIAEVPNLPRWASNRGFVLLVGDAAHPMHPTAAQGFSQTIEDIGVLEYLLKTRPHLPVPYITFNWEQIRRPRVEAIKAYAYANMQLFSGETTATAMVATTEMLEEKPVKSLKEIQPDPNAKYQTAPFLKWVLDYDAIEEAEKWLLEQKARL